MMNERNILVIAVLLIVGIFVVSYFDDGYSGYYVGGEEKCEIISDGLSIFAPQSISYVADTASGIPPTIQRSRCATKTTLSTVKCVQNFRSYYRYNVVAPTGYVCISNPEGDYFVKGDVDKQDSGCSDSDLGPDELFTTGFVRTTNELGGGREKEYWDACAVSNDRFGDSVTEYSCDSAGNVRSRVQQCPSGIKCSNGRCVR